MSKQWASKFLVLALVLVLSLGVAAGCAKKDETKDNEAANKTEEKLSGKVTASGSSALLPMVKQAATEFMDANKDVTVDVTAGGSGTGLKNVAGGVSNIGNSDVEAGEEFKDANLVDHVVCIAPFALIVNKDVNVDGLTKDQAAKILKGEIKNWKEVGGNDEAITVVHRPDSSGSRKLVKKIVLDDAEFTKEGVVQESSGAVKTTVAGTKGAIGYVDTPYVDDTLKALKFDGAAYSADAIKDGSYKLFGIEHMYTKGEATGAVKAFLDYILSEKFQTSTLKDLGFLPADTLSK